LEAPSNPSASQILPRLVFLLKTRVLPEAEVLSQTGLDEQTLSKLRTNIAHLLFGLTCLNVDGSMPSFAKDDVFGGSSMANTSEWMDHVKWAVQVLAEWYRAGTAQPWRAVLEGTLQQLVCISMLNERSMATINIFIDTRRMANISSHTIVFAQTHA
jgi:hypothetical protein